MTVETWRALRALLQRPIAFHRALAELAGSTAGGVFLSQALYWQERSTDDAGWYWKTQAEWYDETMLTRSEQERARARLRELGVLHEKKAGTPAKLYYRVDFERLYDLLGSPQADPQTRMLDRADLGVQNGQASLSNPATSYNTETTSIDYAETTLAAGAREPAAAAAPAPAAAAAAPAPRIPFYVVQQAATLYRDGLTDGHTATLLEWWAGLPPQEREAYVGSMAVYAARETAKYTGGGPVLRYFCTVLRRCLQHPTDYDERQRAEAEGRPAPAPKRGARQTAIPTKQDGTIDESQLSPIMRGILEQSKEQAAERRAARERAAGAGMKGDTN